MSDAAIAEYIVDFLLVLLRAGVFVSLMPMFGSKEVPARFKIGLAVAMALVLTPVVNIHAKEDDIAALVFREILLGAAMGLAVRFVFLAVELAGNAISTSIGLSMASVFDPEIGQSYDVSKLKFALAAMLFFSLDIHHEVIRAFVRSYDLVGIGMADIGGMTQAVVSLTSRVFESGVKLAIPAMAGMLIVNILLGFMSKMVPQMNVYFVSLPVYLVLGMLILMFSVPAFIFVLKGEFASIGALTLEMAALGGGH